MSRTLPFTAHESQRVEFAYLYELNYSGGTLYLTNAPHDISWDGNTWVSLGGNLVHEAVQEDPNTGVQEVILNLFGVDQTIISSILSNNFRGRIARIYIVYFDPDTGVMATPYMIAQGPQMGDYEIRENRQEIEDSGGVVEVSATIASPLARQKVLRSVRTNVTSHNEMLRRAGLSTGDQFCSRVNTLQGKKIYWGTEGSDDPIGDTPKDKNTEE